MSREDVRREVGRVEGEEEVRGEEVKRKETGGEDGGVRRGDVRREVGREGGKEEVGGF